MAVRKNYIDNQKVFALFDELRAENRLCEKNFISVFKQKFFQDYKLLESEWELKKRDFRKNRKGNPKPYPVKPDEILQKIYRKYYFKIIKQSQLKNAKEKELSNIRSCAGRYGCKIIREGNTKTYNVVDKKSRVTLYKKCSLVELKNIFYEKEGRRHLLKMKSERGKLE